MNLKSLNLLAAAAIMLLLAAATGRAQSLSYSNAIVSLNAAGYWPMHEVEASVPGDVETNWGTLGLLGTGYYPDYQVNVNAIIRPMPGPLANGSDQAVYFTGPSNAGSPTNGLMVPRTVSLASLKPPFTVECWFMATNIGTGQGDIWSQADGTKTTGIRVYYQNSVNDQVSVLTYPSGQINFANFTTNAWHHMVVTCSATTNFSTWFDGVQGASLAAAGKYTYDTHTPFTMGTGLGFARAFHGLESEVAVYTNVLSDITTHYNDGINASASASQYFNDVTNDNPVIYLRMNNPGYTVPAGPWPSLVNYGQTNGVAVGNGVYTPGTQPGLVTGTSYNSYPVGLASGNVALLSGVSSFADAGFAPAFNPAGAAPFSVSALFRSNPTDTNRVQSILGHGTNSWELDLTAAGFLVFNSGTNSAAVVATGSGPGDLVSTNFAPDNGSWHLVTAVHSGTTNVLYLDGVPNNTNVLQAANNVGNSLDVMIGSDPCYTNTPVGLGRQFAGEVCEAAFFTNALTQAQVAALYSASGILPKITQQPVSSTNNQGNAYTNTVAATGSIPLDYQWYAGGAPISGATNASLIYNPVLPADASPNYFVVVSNNFGAVTSSVVSLTVYGLPFFTAQFPVTYTNPFTLYAGTSPTFSVTALGPQPINYQWHTNGVLVGSATGSSLTLTSVATGSLSVYCTASNSIGATNSVVWTASVIPAPTAPYPAAVLTSGPIGYWRLNETPDDGNGDQGDICHDYAGGNDGSYTNVTLAQPGYNTTTDPSETSTLFGETGISFYDSYAGRIAGVDFATPTNTSATFTIEAWVNGYAGSEVNGAGLVSKGYGNGGEQFDLDVYNGAYRFLVRDVTGAAHGPTSTNKVDGNWHHIVGVCDEVHSNVSLYVDGVFSASVAVTPGSGLLEDTLPMCIGARPSAANTNNNLQFYGYMDDVAVYNYALSPTVIAAHFSASGVAPLITALVTGTNVDTGANLILPAVVIGTPPLNYKWFDVNANAYVAGQTNATLVISNITTSDNYYLTVGNSFGTTNSAYVNVNVYSGKPTLVADVQNPFYAIGGGSATNSVQAFGSAPLAWQWQFFNGTSWVNLTDNSRISGSQAATLTLANTFGSDAGNYQVVITNPSGSITSSVATLVIADLPLSFFDNGLLWTANGSARMANGLLSLTDPNNGGGSGTYFFQKRQYIGAFQAAFTYQAGGNMAADGFTFCLQNDSRGPAALASGGGGLAVGNGGVITPSAELEFNIYTPSGVGYAFETNGLVPAGGGFTAPGAVAVNGGDPINFVLTYGNGRMALALSDTVAGTSFVTNLNVGDLTKVLGGTSAYVGFTGAYGGATSVQTITNFTFVSLATEAINLNNGTNILISWPGAILGYVLQQNADLTTTNWLDVATPTTMVNGQNQVMVPLNGTNQFFRLMLSQ